MADYKIQIGTQLDTKGIDTGISKYHQKKSIEFKSKLDTSGIDKKIASYKVKKPIEINTKLNTSGLAKKIGEYKPKTPIKLNAKLDTKNIDFSIRNYKAKAPIKVDIKLDNSDISKQIRAYKTNAPIKVNVKLDSNDITKQIREYQTRTPIKLGVKLATKDIDEKIRNYKAKTPIKLDVKINKSVINEQIKSFNPKNTIKLKAALQKGAIAEEIRKYKPNTPIKVDLELNYSDIDKKVGEYIAAKGAVELPVKLKPANKGFSDSVTKKPIKVNATLEADDINKAIDNFKAASKIKVDVKLNPKDISAQIQKLPKPTEPLSVDVDLNENSINNAIAVFKPTSKLKVHPDLVLEDIDNQINAYVPKSKIKVNVNLDDNDIGAEIGKQKALPPIKVNVKLDREKINEQIRAFTTKTKIKVGIKLDSKGISEQIKKIEPKTKIKVGIELDQNDIAQQIGNINTSTPVRLGIELDPNGVQNVNNQLDNIRQQIQQLGNITINFGGNPRNRGIGNVTSAFERASREVYNLYKQIESMELKLGKLEMSGIDSGNIAEYRNQLNQLRQTYENLLATMGGQNGAINLDVVFTDIDHAKTSIKELSSAVDNARTKLASDIKIDINNGKLQGEIDSVIQKFNQLGITNQGVTRSVEELQRMLTNMRVSNNIESVTSDYQEFLQLLKTVKNAVNDLEREMNETNRPEILNAAREAAMQRLNGLFEEGSQAAKQFGARAEQLRNELNSVGNVKGVEIVNKKIKNLGTEIKNSNLQTKTWTTSIKEQFDRYKNYISIASVFMYATQGLKSMFEQVKLIDSAMTELKKVTDETDASYNQFLSNAAMRAKEIGTTIDGLVSSTADFARLGYDFADAQGLAEVANIYAVVGDEIDGVEDATQSLISTLAAFKDEIGDMGNDEFALSIVDKMNEVANNYAISSGGLGEALQRSASSMAAANNSLDETIAMITAANEVAQDPEKVGNAMKTISMRIRGAKTELEEAGESTDGMAESTAKLRAEIMALSGVDIMLDSKNFKSTYQIMDELSQKWEGLSDIAQASITELMAGKHQGNVMSSLMANFDTAREALETSLNSSGSAMKEHEKWSQSLEAQLLKLKAAWQGLSQAFLSSDFLKGALNVVIELVDGLAKLIDKFGAMPTLLAGFAGFKVLFTLFKSGGVSGIKSFADALSLLQLAFPNVTAGASKLTTVLRSMAGASTNANVGIVGLLKGLLTGHPYITAAVVAVTALTTAFMYQKKKAEDLAKAVEETVSSYKEQHNELKKLQGDYDTSNESSMISKYEKLSMGVDNLGRNVSLTADEYSEYQSIVNSIADQIPSLVTGYDEQGNALLSCKGNVEELTDAYEKLIHAQNQEILTNTGNIEKDFKNTIEKQSGTHWWSDGHGFWKGLDILRLADYELKDDTVKALDNVLNADSEEERKQLLRTLENKNVYTSSEIRTALDDAGIDVGMRDVYDVLEETLEKDPQKIKGIVDDYYSQLAEVVEGQKSIAQAKLSEAFDISSAISGLNYSNISEDLQAVAYQVVNSFDYDFLSKLSESGKTVEEWTTEMLNQLNSIGKDNNAQIEAAFDLQTKFNGGEISYGEYVEGLQNTGSLIESLNLKPELESQLKLSLGLNEEGLVEGYNRLKNRLSSNEFFDIASNEYESFINSLSSEEVSVLWDIIPELEKTDYKETISDIKAALEKEMMLQGLTFTLNLEVEAASIEAVNTAISESVTATGLSSESISALKGRYAELESQGYDLSSMFEETSHGVHLNRNEFSKLENELSKQKLAKVDAELTKMKATYDELGDAIKNCNDPVEKSKLFDERQTLAKKISEAATLASQYKGLTSAYNDWLSAEEAGNERDMYENVISGFETVKDELSRGWADDSTIKFLEMLTGRTDLAGKSGKELKEVYDGLGKKIKDTTYSIKDFFTVDDEGNSTSKGIYNFLDAVGQLEEEAFGGKDIVKRDSKGNVIGFDFELAGGDEVIAEALGISEELVQIMVRAADDAGFVVSMDGTYRQLADLQNEAKAAADYLKEIGKTDFDFDFNTSSATNLTNQLVEANKVLDKFKDKDGSIDLNADGAIEAMQVVSTLQAKLDTVTQEKYGIGLTVEDDKYEGALESLQNYGHTVAALNQLEINPKANTEEIKKLEADLTTYATELNNLPDDVKINIGLVGEDGKTPLNDIETIKSKAENGEIKIPTTLDIQANIDKNISDLRDIALLNSDFISDAEKEKIKIRLGIEVEGGDVDDTKLQEDIANGIHDNSAYWSENKPKVEVNSEVEIKTSSIDTDGAKEDIDNAIHDTSAYWTGANGRKRGMGIDVDANVNVDANVDTSKAEEKTKKKTEEVVEAESGETATLEKDVELEFNISDYTDKLSQFKDVAKELDGLEDVDITVDANFDGNVLSGDGDLSKLSTFAEGAKALQGVESSDVSVEAELECDFNGGDLDSLIKFADGASKIEGVKSSDVSVKVEIDGNLSEYNGELEDIGKFADNAKKLNGVKDANVSIKVVLESEFNETNFDDLAKFADNAIKLNGVKDSDVSIDAYLYSNLSDNDNLDKLKTFAEGAEALQDVKTKEVEITANLNGNLADNTNLDNLDEFADGAKDLQGIKGNKVEITTNLFGNLNENNNIDNLDKFVDSAKDLQGIKGNKVEITTNLNGNLADNSNLDNLDAFADGAKDLQGIKSNDVKITANLSGNLAGNGNLGNLKTFADGAEDLQGIKSKDVRIDANLYGNLIGNGNLDNVETFADGAEDLQGIESKNVRIDANVYGNLVGNGNLNNLGTFSTRAKELQGIGNVNVTVKANVDSASINTAIALLTQVANSGLFKDYNATVKVGAKVDNIDDTVVKEYIATEKEAKGKVKWSNEDSLVNQFKKKIHEATGRVNWGNNTKNVKTHFNATGTVTWTSGNNVIVKVLQYANGTADADGSALSGGSASGRAFARGDWGIKGSGIALGGELGRELVVRDGRYFTIGDNGAEFFQYKPNDIVFNATQTEALLKYGGIKGANPRGKMLATGSAFSGGSAFAEGLAFSGSSGSGGGFWTNASTGKTYGKSSSSSSSDSDDSKEDFEETIDWIEVIIDRIERAIDQLGKKADNIYKSWTERNAALINQISKVRDEISIQQQAYDRYIAAANGVGLDSSWVEKIQNGKIDIETVNDEALKEKIDDYQQWYEKALDCKNTIEELKETESSLYAQRVENAATQYDGILGVVEYEKNMLEEYINQSEAQAWLVSSEYYDALAKNELENIAELQNKKASMLVEFENAMNSGTIAKGSESYYEMVNSIDEVTLAITESRTVLLEYEQTIQQLSWEIFDLLQDKISAVTDETEFLVDLLSNDKLHNDNGKLTDEGKATMGLHGVAYNAYMHQADKAAEEAERLKKELAEDPYDTELEERYREMIFLQQEYILAAEDERDAIKSLVEEGIELEIEALEERIDKYNEALSSQKDLYEYQKKVKEQTQEIASIEKQIASYSGDTSEESRAKVQELRVSLEEAKADLEETEYDKYISDTEQMLDNLVLEYQEVLNMRFDNIDALIENVIEEVNTDSSIIGDTIRETANSVGYTLSDSMKVIWDENATNTKNVITTYGDKFIVAQTTTNTALNTINTNLQNMISQINSIAKTNTKSASTSSVSKPSSNKKGAVTTKVVTKNSTTTRTNVYSGNYGKPKIGDRVKYVSGQYYYDSQGKKPIGSYNKGEYVYITNINTKDWATHGYHISTGNKLGKGDLGWLKLSQLSGYATGKKNFLNDEMAWTQEGSQEFIIRPSDGAILTPIAKGDSILTSAASKNIWDMANSPADFIKSNLNLGSTNVPNNSNIQSNYTQHLDNVIFSFPNVKNYDEMLSSMQKDKNFEHLIQSMTIDQIAGKSALGKGKSIR